MRVRWYLCSAASQVEEIELRRDVEQRIALAVIDRPPIERLLRFKKERGWRNLKLYSDLIGEFSRDYHAIAPEAETFRRSTHSRASTGRFWPGALLALQTRATPAIHDCCAVSVAHQI
jgi:predicted dithiol-disulfide oxidoreductase (DUF899 family)